MGDYVVVRIPGGVFGGKSEHDQRHWRGGDGVVLLEVVLHGFGQETNVGNLVVNLLVGLRMHVIAETQRPQVLVLHHRRSAQHVGEKDLGQVDLERRLAAALDQLEKLLPVLVIIQSGSKSENNTVLIVIGLHAINVYGCRLMMQYYHDDDTTRTNNNNPFRFAPPW